MLDKEAERRAVAELHDHAMARVDAAKVKNAPVKTKNYLPPPVKRPELDEELARMAGGTTDRWFLTCRQALLAEGLIETVLKEDGTWDGTRITAKGLARLRKPT